MLDYKKLKYPNKKVGGIGNDINDNNSYTQGKELVKKILGALLDNLPLH